MGTWLAGGVILHDAIIAPVTVLLGVVAARVLPGQTRAVAAIAFLVWATLTVAFINVLSGQGGKPDNDTVLNRPYALSWVVLTAAIVAAAAVVSYWRRRVSHESPQTCRRERHHVDLACGASRPQWRNAFEPMLTPSTTWLAGLAGLPERFAAMGSIAFAWPGSRLLPERSSTAGGCSLVPGLGCARRCPDINFVAYWCPGDPEPERHRPGPSAPGVEVAYGDYAY